MHAVLYDFHVIPSLFHPGSQSLLLLLWPKAPLPKLITACHIILGSLHSEASSRRPPQVLKTDVTGLLKWVISTALLSSAAVARMGTKLSSPGHGQEKQGAKGLEDKVTVAHSWHCGSSQNYLLMSFSILGRAVEPELSCLKAVRHTVRDKHSLKRVGAHIHTNSRTWRCSLSTATSKHTYTSFFSEQFWT